METPTKTPKPPPPPPLPMPGGLATAIGREELMQLPLWRYSGPVRLVNSPASLAQAQAALESATILGLDTETQPTFRKAQVHLPCLVQVAAAEAVYLFQLRQVNCADYLTGLLGRADVIKAGIGLDHDFAKLKQVFPFAPREILCKKIRQAAKMTTGRPTFRPAP